MDESCHTEASQGEQPTTAQKVEVMGWAYRKKKKVKEADLYSAFIEVPFT